MQCCTLEHKPTRILRTLAMPLWLAAALHVNTPLSIASETPSIMTDTRQIIGITKAAGNQ